jgi:hypothetical protein
MLVKPVPAQAGIGGFDVIQRARLLQVPNTGGVIMQGTELVVTAPLCFTSGGFHISTKNSNPTSVGMLVLVCGQSMIHNHVTLFKEDYYV